MFRLLWSIKDTRKQILRSGYHSSDLDGVFFIRRSMNALVVVIVSVVVYLCVHADLDGAILRMSRQQVVMT